MVISNRVCVSIQEDDKPLDQVTGTFLRTFTKNDHFKVGCTICILLQDNLLTSSEVRVPFLLMSTFLFVSLFLLEGSWTDVFVYVLVV